MALTGRKFSSGGEYRYGFNGQEKDDEVKGGGNSYDFDARLYDSRLGRWLSIDPLFKKYPDLSPFSYSANNPIIYKDKNGEDWGITTTFDKDGNKTIHITVTAAVINSSSNKNIIMRDFQTAVKTQIEDAYTVKYKEVKSSKLVNIYNGLDRSPEYITVNEYRDVKVVVDVQIRTITDKKNLAKNEHLFDIVDDKNITTSDKRSKGLRTGGEGEFYGNYIRINEKEVGNIINRINKKTIPHELGHTGGLFHPNNGGGFLGFFKSEQHIDAENAEKNKNNLMYQSVYSRKELGNKGDGNEVSKKQIEILNKNYKKGDLNKNTVPK